MSESKLQEVPSSATTPKQQSLPKRIWTKLGLDIPTITTMIKFALPPTISLCIYQSNAISATFSSVGYLIAVGSILSSGLQPRAAYIEATVSNVLFVSFTTLVAMFAMWTVLKARENQIGSNLSLTAYSSSASAVAGVWVFFMIYIINVCFICYLECPLTFSDSPIGS